MENNIIYLDLYKKKRAMNNIDSLIRELNHMYKQKGEMKWNLNIKTAQLAEVKALPPLAPTTEE